MKEQRRDFALPSFCKNNVYIPLNFTDVMFRLRVYYNPKDHSLLWEVGGSDHTVDGRALMSFGVSRLCDMNYVVLDSACGVERRVRSSSPGALAKP